MLCHYAGYHYAESHILFIVNYMSNVENSAQVLSCQLKFVVNGVATPLLVFKQFVTVGAVNTDSISCQLPVL